MSKLIVVIASTRPGRIGLPIANWFIGRAREHAGFEVEVADLAEVNLPFLDEPQHPRFKKYEHEHTKKWSRTVSSADAFVFVTPEYDYGMPATLLNALHFLFGEWNYKPAGFVSYGGISGGLRSVQMAKLVVSALRMMPIPEGVTLPFAAKSIADGVFAPGDMPVASAKTMLDELVRWANALKVLR